MAGVVPGHGPQDSGAYAHRLGMRMQPRTHGESAHFPGTQGAGGAEQRPQGRGSWAATFATSTIPLHRRSSRSCWPVPPGRKAWRADPAHTYQGWNGARPGKGPDWTKIPGGGVGGWMTKSRRPEGRVVAFTRSAAYLRRRAQEQRKRGARMEAVELMHMALQQLDTPQNRAATGGNPVRNGQSAPGHEDPLSAVRRRRSASRCVLSPGPVPAWHGQSQWRHGRAVPRAAAEPRRR